MPLVVMGSLVELSRRVRRLRLVVDEELDPYIRYLHMPRGRHLCLASDLMEEFRLCVLKHGYKSSFLLQLLLFFLL